MTAAPANAHYFYPNRMGRILLLSMKKELGAEQVLNVLRAAGHERLLSTMPLGNFEKRFPFETVSAMQCATEDVFGVRAGRQINHRVGRGTLELGLKDFDPLLGIADLPMRLMPSPRPRWRRFRCRRWAPRTEPAAHQGNRAQAGRR